MVSLRWAFRCGSWQPTAEEWIHGMACIQQEERERIQQFAFQRDAKSALAGRLLIRKAVSDSLNIPYQSIALGRSDKGRPYLLNNLDRDLQLPGFDFNISHHGDFVVLAAESSHNVGIDLMNVDRPVGSKTVDQFFSTMTRQFTKQEWDSIRSASDENGQLHNFYRFWCLKESFVKLVGLGIGYSLRRLNFLINSPLSVNKVVNDTNLEIDDRLQTDLKFEETMLDNCHIATVALKQLPQTVPDSRCDLPSYFHLEPKQLLHESMTQHTPQMGDWEDYNRKPSSPTAMKNG